MSQTPSGSTVTMTTITTCEEETSYRIGEEQLVGLSSKFIPEDMLTGKVELVVGGRSYKEWFDIIAAQNAEMVTGRE